MPLAPAAAGGWAIVTSPNSRGLRSSYLSDVTCASAWDCWAVGSVFESNRNSNDNYTTLIERWDGTSWARVASPNTTDAGGNAYGNFFTGVTCVSASDCWAVGFYNTGSPAQPGTDQTVIERWDGTSWAIVSSPNTSATHDNVLSGVTCVSASNCWAVGYYLADNATGGAAQTLIERWDGTSWAIVTSPNTSVTLGNYLSGVTCVSASDCWAVGYEIDVGTVIGTTSRTLIERWNGTSWAIITSLNTTAAQSVLSGVTCASASDCWAVGFSNTGGTDQSGHGGASQTLVERWNGILWAIVTSPNTAATQSVLSSVTCASASDCWAVGFSNTGSAAQPGSDQTVVERWNGTLWAIVASPNTTATQNNFLSDVTCVSASGCWAVGEGYDAITGLAHTLVERWDGASWAIVPSPITTAAQHNFLNGVTCVSASDCWAVGYDFGKDNQQTLIERWDGTSWAIVASPNTSALQRNTLQTVTCVSASDCWAVGAYVADIVTGNNQTLVERWDGTSWAIVASPNTSSTQYNFLQTVTCVSASDCWAVGAYSTGTALQTLIEQWDGSSWAIVTSPNTSPTKSNVLYGMTCLSASDCWAVGAYRSGTTYQTLIERWDGTSWAIVTSPNKSATLSNFLYAVTCVSASDCWAVGAYNSDGSRTYQTLIERWNGISWAIVTSPNISSTALYNYLYGVTCASASDCWAVGYVYPGTIDNPTADQTLVERWDGTSWAIVTSPNTSSTQYNFLQTVTCVSASDCWAVGYYLSDASKTYQTLIQRYTASTPPTPTSVVSRKTHGTTGDFDIDLPLTGTRGIECRSGGANSNYTLVFTFTNNLTSVGGASVTSHNPTNGTGTVSSSAIGPNPNQYTVNLTGVSTGQYITVTLNSVLDATGASGNVLSPQMGVLVGDVNASGIVTSGDTNLCKAQALQPVTNANFRNDINASGAITTGDVNIIKQNALSQLPP